MVQAPVGCSVTNIPAGAETVTVNKVTNYYYGGGSYEKDGTAYTVVPPPVGASIGEFPEGGEEVKTGDQTDAKIGEIYSQPLLPEGQDQYEAAQV